MSGNGQVSPNKEVKTLTARLESYFLGKRVEFSLDGLPIDRSAWSEFEQSVASALASVPYGKAISYADLAVAASYPRACRAVGNFMARNPFPLLIPCHRVIRSDGRPGKYSAGGHWKLRLLELEGVHHFPLGLRHE